MHAEISRTYVDFSWIRPVSPHPNSMDLTSFCGQPDLPMKTARAGHGGSIPAPLPMCLSYTGILLLYVEVPFLIIISNKKSPARSDYRPILLSTLFPKGDQLGLSQKLTSRAQRQQPSYGPYSPATVIHRLPLNIEDPL